MGEQRDPQVRMQLGEERSVEQRFEDRSEDSYFGPKYYSMFLPLYNELTTRRSINPCFCHSNATCTLSGGQEFNVTTPGKAGYNASATSDLCIEDPAATCTFKNKEILRFLEESPQRDCNSARGGRCSPGQPCTPCEWSRKEEFGERWSRCSICNSNNVGKCNFVPGVGPYCYKSATSREVVPCTKCCTEKVLEFDDDGICF